MLCRDRLPSTLGPVTDSGMASATVKTSHKVLTVPRSMSWATEPLGPRHPEQVSTAYQNCLEALMAEASGRSSPERVLHEGSPTRTAHEGNPVPHNSRSTARRT